MFIFCLPAFSLDPLPCKKIDVPVQLLFLLFFLKGGAVNIGSGGSLVTSGIVTYIDNDAVRLASLISLLLSPCCLVRALPVATS